MDIVLGTKVLYIIEGSIWFSVRVSFLAGLSLSRCDSTQNKLLLLGYI